MKRNTTSLILGAFAFITMVVFSVHLSLLLFMVACYYGFKAKKILNNKISKSGFIISLVGVVLSFISVIILTVSPTRNNAFSARNTGTNNFSLRSCEADCDRQFQNCIYSNRSGDECAWNRNNCISYCRQGMNGVDKVTEDNGRNAGIFLRMFMGK